MFIIKNLDCMAFECSICISDISIDQDIFKLSKCEHMFHTKCIKQWLIKQNKSCPNCRVHVDLETLKQLNIPTPTQQDIIRFNDQNLILPTLRFINAPRQILTL